MVRSPGLLGIHSTCLSGFTMVVTTVRKEASYKSGYLVQAKKPDGTLSPWLDSGWFKGK